MEEIAAEIVVDAEDVGAEVVVDVADATAAVGTAAVMVGTAVAGDDTSHSSLPRTFADLRGQKLNHQGHMDRRGRFSLGRCAHFVS